jgi:hypothetical protein
MKRKPAIIVAGIYWLSVVGSYIAALIVHDQFGFSFIPFAFLSWPWSLFVNDVAAGTQVHGIAVAGCAVLCFLLSGLNALMLYFFTAGCSAVRSKIVGRWRS